MGIDADKWNILIYYMIQQEPIYSVPNIIVSNPVVRYYHHQYVYSGTTFAFLNKPFQLMVGRITGWSANAPY